jgi:DNA repair protein RadC
MKKGGGYSMKQDIQHTEKFLKGLTTLTGLPYKKVQQYVKGNNPLNILEHPHIMEPNEKQLEKIGLLNEFIASYNILKIYESNEKVTLNSSTLAGQYFLALLGGMKDKERFMVAFLDSGNNIIETKTMSEGSIGQTAVYPREILKYALACDCNAMILAHNHPGGSKNFSPEDRALTQRMVDIFHPLEIKVLDHIIVGGGSYTSMAEKGIIPCQSKGTANYDAIVLGAVPAKERQNRFQDTHSR